MKKTILNESDYNYFYKVVIYGKIENELKTSIKSAYRDVCRTISGFMNHKDHDKIYKSCSENLYAYISNMLKSENINSQADFDKWHFECCNMLILNFKNQKFYFGQAQKWINMTLKNLSMLNHELVQNVYEFFHVPIDNYILKITGYTFKTTWSRIESYEKYLEFQKWFRVNYSGIPLDIEFKMWLEEVQNQRK